MKKFFTLITAFIVSTAMAFAGDTYIITGDYNSWSLTDNCITFAEQEDGSFVASADEFTTGQWGFKIVKNQSWDYQYGSSISLSVSTGQSYSIYLGSDNIYLGKANNNVTLHNVKFEFTPGSDGALDNFKITADETITASKTEAPKYSMVGTWQEWSLSDSPLEFEDQGNGVYTASIDEIYGEWKIVKNGSWNGAYGGDGTEMLPGNTYNLVRNSNVNASFATGKILKDVTFTLTVADENNATLKIEGTSADRERTYGLVGEFQGWRTTKATLLTQQEDGSWTADIKAFPGGESFKISIDKSWDCFQPVGASTKLSFGEACTCEREKNGGNHFTIGEKGTNYDVHVVLVVGQDEQWATLTITNTTADGINQINAETAKSTIYSISGQKLTDLKKGINIVNGKKVIKK